MPRPLGLIGVRAEWDRKIGLQSFGRNRLVILKLQPLGSIRRDGDDGGAEHRTALSSFRSTFPHLQEARINPLRPKLVIDLLRAFALQNHGWNASWPIPYREVRNCGLAGERKNVVPFFDSATVVGENLFNKDAGVAIVDADCDLHLFEGEYGRIGLRLVAWNQDAGIRQQQR